MGFFTRALFTGCGRDPHMSVTITKQHVRNFYDARMSRDPGIIAPFLADDVEWSITGPIDRSDITTRSS